MENENRLNGKEKEIEEFVAEYATFEKSLKAKMSQIPYEQLVTLYAIFRKDARTDRVNGNGYKSQADQPATEKQIATIEGLIKRGRVKFDPSLPPVSALTRKQASDVLSAVYGKSPGKWRKPSTSFCSYSASGASSGNHPKPSLAPLKYGRDYI
ncbi:Uncharacterised protein [uncultured archaeon]|nr:Uncharacterised protein [uncultured archaeon]